MVTAYSPILKLALPVQGELSGTWGDVVNDNITSMVEQAIAGRAVIDTWTTNSHVLTTANGTTSESRCAMLEFTDTGTALSGAGTVTCPTLSKIYIAKNASGQNVTLKTSGGTGILVPNGRTMFLFCDGTNVVEAVTSTTSLQLGTSTIVTAVLDEDNMASDSATSLATQQSIKAYVDSQVGANNELSEVLANGNTSGANDIIMTSGQKITVDTIDETTAAAGVTIDSVLLKDDGVNATNLEITNIKANDGTAAGSIADSTGVVTVLSSILTTADINGGTADGVIIGGTTPAAATVTNLIANTDLIIAGTTTITAVLDEDNMASDSATALATQQSIKAYVDAQVDTVDTLAEILAIGNTTGATDIAVDSAQKVQFRDAAIYINSSVDGQLDIVADTEIQIAATTVDINGAVALDGAMTGGTNITISGELDAATLDISGNIDVDGVSNLDEVDIDGATQIDATVTVGVNDTGYDVKFFGDTAGKSLLWDTSEDKLNVTGSVDITGPVDITGLLDVTGTVEFDGLSGTGLVTVTNILDEDNMASNSATALATQQSIKAYVDSGGSTNALAVVLTAGNTTGGTNVEVTTTDKVQFRDAAIYINSSVDGQLDIVADTEVQVAATTVDITGSLIVDGSTFNVSASTNRVGILNSSPDVTLDIGTATDAVHMPSGSTGQRPLSPAAGYFRYNTTTAGFEGYTDEWGEIGGGGANLTTDNFTGDASTTAFTLSIDPEVEQNTFVYINGVYQQKNTYSTSGTTLTFSTAPPSGTSIEVMSMTATNSIVGTVSDNAITTAKIADDQVTGDKLANNIDIAGTLDVTGLLTADASVAVTGDVDILAQGNLRLQDLTGGQYVAMKAPATIGTSYTITLPADDGDASQFLQTDGSGVTSWATVSIPASVYNAWLVKTTTYTAVTGDQLIANNALTAFTITLPASPSVGDTVTFKNVGAALLTVGRNSENINSAAEDATMPTGNAAQLVYVDVTIGWTTL